MKEEKNDSELQYEIFVLNSLRPRLIRIRKDDIQLINTNPSIRPI